MTEKTILLIEDEDLVRSTTKRMLEASGYTVIEAIDGVEGVEVFIKEKQRIDLVLLDMLLPQKSGEEVLDELLTLDPHVRVVLVSGRPVSAEAFPAASCVVAKPYGLETLVSRIEGVFQTDDSVQIAFSSAGFATAQDSNRR